MGLKTIPQDDSKEFAPHPKGPVLARCIHVLDLGEMVKEWQGLTSLKPGVQFVFYTGVAKENGEPFLLTSREFTNSMGDKANLRKFLESWRGAAYTDEQARQPIDLDKLVNKACQLTIDHGVSKKGRKYATIVAISPVLPQVADHVPKVPEPVPAVPDYLLERVEQYAIQALEYRERIGLNRDVTPGSLGSLEEAEGDDLPF